MCTKTKGSLNIPHWWLAFVRNCVRARRRVQLGERAHYHPTTTIEWVHKSYYFRFTCRPNPPTPTTCYSHIGNGVQWLLRAPRSQNCVSATWLLHIHIQMRSVRRWVSGWVAEWPGYWGQWQHNVFLQVPYFNLFLVYGVQFFFFFFFLVRENILCAPCII